MNFVLHAFPKRQMRIVNPKVQKPFISLIAMAVLVSIAAILPVLQVPGLLEDMKIAQNPLEDNQATLNGRCKTRLVLVYCDISIQYEAPGSRTRLTTHRTMSLLSFGRFESSGVVRHAKDSSLVTTTIGIENIYNRIFSQVVWIGLFLGIVVIGLRNLARNRRLTKIARSGQAVDVEPVVLTLTKSLAGAAYYGGTLNGKSIKYTIGGGAVGQAFCLSDDESTVLAVKVIQTGALMMLDDQLSMLDFTDAERSALRYAASQA